jgi:hypothetical protein
MRFTVTITTYQVTTVVEPTTMTSVSTNSSSETEDIDSLCISSSGPDNRDSVSNASSRWN